MGPGLLHRGNTVKQRDGGASHAPHPGISQGSPTGQAAASATGQAASPPAGRAQLRWVKGWELRTREKWTWDDSAQLPGIRYVWSTVRCPTSRAVLVEAQDRPPLEEEALKAA
jgi:hypothetical protein